MTTDSDKELEAVLGYLVGRRLNVKEVYEALDMPRSTFNALRDEGRLVNADNLIKAAQHFNISAVDLLVRYGLLSADSVVDYCEREGLVGDPSLATMAPEGQQTDRRRRQGSLASMAPRSEAPAM